MEKQYILSKTTYTTIHNEHTSTYRRHKIWTIARVVEVHSSSSSFPDHITLYFLGWSDRKMKRLALSAIDKHRPLPTETGRFKKWDFILAQDTDGNWLLATVMGKLSGMVYISYHGWDQAWNEWIQDHSPRLARLPSRFNGNRMDSSENKIRNNALPLACKKARQILFEMKQEDVLQHIEYKNQIISAKILVSVNNSQNFNDKDYKYKSIQFELLTNGQCGCSSCQ